MTDSGLCRVIACPRPFSVDRVDFQVAAGETVAALIGRCGMSGERMFSRVFLDDRLIPQAEWERVRPAAGQLLTVRAVPTGGGGGGKDALRIVASIAVIAMAIYAPYALASLAPGTFGVGGTSALFVAPGVLGLGGALVSAGVGIGLSLAVTALIPPAPLQLTLYGKGRGRG